MVLYVVQMKVRRQAEENLNYRSFGLRENLGKLTDQEEFAAFFLASPDRSRKDGPAGGERDWSPRLLWRLLPQRV